MKKVYLAFDPGGATGWAKAENEDDTWYITSGTKWEPEHHSWIFHTIGNTHSRLLQTDPAITIITESFEFRNSTNSRRGLELISREYIGIMKFVCGQHDIPLVQQMPSHALNFITDEKLHKLGNLRKPLHDCRHENDALRHLFKYLISTEKEQFWKDMLKK